MLSTQTINVVSAFFYIYCSALELNKLPKQI